MQVGTSGGQAYLRGDPFGTQCLYNASKVFYPSTSAHPPQIGWALDGYSIYGRHISSSNLGYATSLDDCGGHVHDGITTYHYHTQVLTVFTDKGGVYPGGQVGLPYTTTIPGPYKCLKGDISAVVNYWMISDSSVISWTTVIPDNTQQPCCASPGNHNHNTPS